MSGQNRVSFYIDGFNFYHRIKAYEQQTGKCLKWLDYKSLCSSFLRDGQTLAKVYFFTAISNFHGKDSLGRHNKYINALSISGVEIIRGYFKRNMLTGKSEEKKTDCNIVAKLLEDAFCNNFDTAFILSADSDIVPAVEVIKRNPQTKTKTILIAPPPFEGPKRINNPLAEHNISNFLKECDGKKRIKFSHLQSHLFPRIVKHKNIKVTMPKSYSPKAY